MLKRILNVAITLIIFNSPSFTQDMFDVVYLKDGSRIVGIIIEQIPNQSIKIRTRDGSEFVYTFDQIESITRESIRIVPRDLKGESYPEIGVNIGTPAGLNFALGHWFGDMGIRVSGMFYGRELNGIQGNVGYKFSDNIRRSHSIAIIVGQANIDFNEWRYLGMVYELNLRGFFLQAGLTTGRGDFSTPQIALQIGYMYRFFGR